MKKLFIICLFLIATLSACTKPDPIPDATVSFNIEDDYLYTAYQFDESLTLAGISAISTDGMNYTPFINITGDYDLDIQGTYNLVLDVTENNGATTTVSIILMVLDKTCEIDNTQDKCVINVSGITLSVKTQNISNIYIDDFAKLDWIITPLDAENAEVSLESSDESIATINEYGYIFGHKVGTVTFTITTLDGDYSITKVVTVSEKTCLVDPTQLKCADDTLLNDSRVVTLPDENVSGTDYNLVYVNNKIYYEIFVRKFADSDGNYIGDFQGIIDNLPYLKQLGVGGIWLMPIMDSRSDHGYETDDYYNVNSDYGTMDDFKEMVAAADGLGIDIIIDLVVNHMGARNAIFQDVLKNGTNSDYFDWFTWIDSNDPRYGTDGAWGQQIWYNPTSRTWLTDNKFSVYSSLNNYSYCAYFSDWMPDLNVLNPDVVDYINDVGRWWITETGIAGYRMDATSHIYGHNEFIGITDRDEANKEFLKQFHNNLETVDSDVFVVVEAWESYQTYAKYAASDASAFNFQAGYWIRDVVNGGMDNFGYSIKNVYDEFEKYNVNHIDTPFLTNHDQTRIAEELSSLEKTRLAGEILLTLPGSPFLYYGEELGMLGTRTNMIWGDYYDDALNASFEDKELDTVSKQLVNSDSLLNSYIDLATARNNSLALSYGEFVPYYTSGLDGFYRVFDNGTDKELVIVLFNNSATSIQPIPSEFTSYEILYNSYDYNLGGLSPKSLIVLKLPYAMLDTLIN